MTERSKGGTLQAVSPDLVSLLTACCDQCNARAYSRNGQIRNLKELAETVNYLKTNCLCTVEDLEIRVEQVKGSVDGLKKTMDAQTARMKQIRAL